jgi:divalent metal cation (Fe/Co/Zn/Cd) transporter
LKLPGDLSLGRAHAIAEQVEHSIGEAVPELHAVRTHIEPLAEPTPGEEAKVDERAVEAAVREETGRPPRELRFVRTDDGIVAFLTVGLGASESLADAHERASSLEERVRRAVPEIADVVVHTEP